MARPLWSASNRQGCSNNCFHIDGFVRQSGTCRLTGAPSQAAGSVQAGAPLRGLSARILGTTNVLAYLCMQSASLMCAVSGSQSTQLVAIEMPADIFSRGEAELCFGW